MSGIPVAPAQIDDLCTEAVADGAGVHSPRGRDRAGGEDGGQRRDMAARSRRPWPPRPVPCRQRMTAAAAWDNATGRGAANELIGVASARIARATDGTRDQVVAAAGAAG